MSNRAQTSLELLLVVAAVIAVAIVFLSQLRVSATSEKNLLAGRTKSAVRVAKQIK